MNDFGMDWWMKEEEKREDRDKSSEVFLINNQLQQMMRTVEDRIDKEKYEKEEADFSQHSVSHCSLWNVTYANNMENERVALAQGLFLSHIIEHEDFEDKESLQEEVDIQMRRLGNVDWGIYLEYGEQKGRSIL